MIKVKCKQHLSEEETSWNWLVSRGYRPWFVRDEPLLPGMVLYENRSHIQSTEDRTQYSLFTYFFHDDDAELAMLVKLTWGGK